MAKINIAHTATLDVSVDDWRIIADEFLDVDHGPAPSITPGRIRCHPSAIGSARQRALVQPGRLRHHQRATRPLQRNGQDPRATRSRPKKIPGFVRGMRNDWSVVAAGPRHGQ